jgi:hypothetical protein
MKIASGNAMRIGNEFESREILRNEGSWKSAFVGSIRPSLSRA